MKKVNIIFAMYQKSRSINRDLNKLVMSQLFSKVGLSVHPTPSVSSKGWEDKNYHIIQIIINQGLNLVACIIQIYMYHEHFELT